jgi:hypothetical protein
LKKSYYICSYGGSGSYLLQSFLKQFGETYHIHSRSLPSEITKVHREKFTDEIEDNNQKGFVIYIYSKPAHSLLSRASYGNLHWLNIEVPSSVAHLIPGREEREKYFELKEDLINYEQFWDNYVFHKSSFPVLCLNFHHLWENLKALCDFCEIDDSNINHFPQKRNPSHKNNIPEDKNNLFTSLNNKIDTFPEAFIIPGK